MICGLHQPEESGAMNASKHLGSALAMLALAAGTAWAGSPDRLGTSGAPELGLPAGARSIGLAGSDLGTASGVSFGFGFQYDTDYRGVRLGMAMNNFGANMQYSGSDLEHLQQLPGYNPFVAPRDLALSTATFELPTNFQFGMSVPIVRGG